MMYWPPLYSKQRETYSLPHPEDELQRSVNDFWSCILRNLQGNRLQTVINEVSAAFIGRRESVTLPATS